MRVDGLAQEAESDTILFLRDVTIISDRVNQFAKGQTVLGLDSLTRCDNPSGTLSDLLPGFTSAYIRNYGQGTLTTLSIRGTSSNHASLLWNGIRVAPPNIGYVDLSLIQGNFFQEVNVLYGGASPMYGSGAIGGGIHLNNRPVFDSAGWNGQALLSGGSYASLMGSGQMSYSSDKIYSHSAFSLNGSRNDFSYSDLSGEQARMEHAGYFKGGFLQDVAVKLPSDQYLMASAWFQYSDRDIPPSLTEAASEAELMDRSWRTMLVWKDFNRSGILEAKAAYFNEFERFMDPGSEVYSVIRSQVVSGAFESTFELFSHSSLFAGAAYNYEYADLDYYARPEHQQSLAIYASWMQEFESLEWQISANIRQEFLSGFRVPFLYSFGANGKIWNFITGKMSFSRNFRAPTLNERFWVPGGNLDLQPEESYSLEAGITLSPKLGKTESSLSLTGFSSWVENWILWLPATGYWSVQNAQEVWSRGLEVLLSESFSLGAVTVNLSGAYTLTLSTNEKKLSEYDASYDKQLIYTPVNRMMVKLGADWRGYRVSLKGTYTSQVYTTKDNESSLPGYFLLDGILSKTFRLRAHLPVTLQVNLNNILDKQYETVPYRPMPGFNAMGTVVVGLSNPQK
jgi:iron complex outermembrane receptor protein